MNIPDRHYPARRSLNDIGNRTNIVFVTVCTKGRKPILAHPDIHNLLLDIWSDTSQWMTGHYVVMPNHLHLFCSPAKRDSINVRDWIAYWKSRSASRWPRPTESPIWQCEAWDRQLRSSESYAEKWAYVRNNPVRHGFVQNADEWPYQGVIHELRWHNT